MYTKHRTNVLFYSIICSCLFLAQCGHTRRTIKKKIMVANDYHIHNHKKETAHTPPPVTVWIHGTCFNRNPLFHNYFNGKPGLKLITEIDQKHYLVNAAKTLALYSPHQFPIEAFYVYGWSGKLSFDERKENATILYHELQRINDEYVKTHGTEPSIQIISHSHGGNIALNLPSISKQCEKPLIIDKLIMMACPVQAKTMECIKDPMFKRIYSLYSSLDFVQILAPQMVYKVKETKKGRYKAEWKFPPFSNRRFPHHPTVAQVKIKIDGRAIMHGEFTLPKFLSTLHEVLANIDTWYFEQSAVPLWVEKEKLFCVYTNQPSQQLV